MSIITRYLIRAHAGPFLFAFSAITGLLFLTAIAQRFQELAGKGVGSTVILELMILSLPHVVTLSVPMALFAASLWVFAELAENNELVALAGAGVHPGRLLAPLVAVGLVMSLLMTAFNDRLLSGSNARFQDRLEDVSRKSPTLALREGAMNELRTRDGAVRYLVARSVDARHNRLTGVSILDVSRADRPTEVIAERASVARLPNGRDLLLQLDTGQVLTPVLDRPGTLQRLRFSSYDIALRGMASPLQRGERVDPRAERELSFATLRRRIQDARAAGVTASASRGELHRRIAVAFSCLVFLLLAPPLALRYARHGMAMVIPLSVAVLVFFRVGVIWGDRLARAGRISPVAGGWGTVAVLFLVAVVMLGARARRAAA